MLYWIVMYIAFWIVSRSMAMFVLKLVKDYDVSGNRLTDTWYAKFAALLMFPVVGEILLVLWCLMFTYLLISNIMRKLL